MTKKPVEQWKNKVNRVLVSKQNEFELLGYEKISSDDIWIHLTKNVWKNNPEKHLHEVVQTIFQLQIQTYMDYLTVQSLTVTDDTLMDSIQAVMNPER